jgi:hypothetical protein
MDENIYINKAKSCFRLKKKYFKKKTDGNENLDEKFRNKRNVEKNEEKLLKFFLYYSLDIKRW